VTTALKWILTAALALSTAPAVNSTQVLKTSTTWNGAPIQYATSAKPEVQAVMVEIAPGAATVWHKHPVNNFAYMMEGKIRLELEDGTTHEFKAGDAFAEVVNTWHRGVNIGTQPVKILVWYTAEAGGPISIPRPGAKE
jgi:quercetin dioxygenase-like cupin family protein